MQRSTPPSDDGRRFVPFGMEPDVNTRKIEAHFGGFGCGALSLPDGVTYVILCFVNRSGSNYLADLLGATGVMNRANEAFLWDSVSHVERVAPQASFEDYVSSIVRWNVTNGYFAVKAGPDQLALLGRIGFLDAIWPRARFLLIEREDTLDQAISFAIALRTGVWVADASTAPPPAPAYSRADIEQTAGFIAQGRAGLERFFAANAVTPLRVVYETLVAEPQAELDRIGRWLGIGTLRAAPERLRTLRQADATNRAWRARYLAGD